MLLPCQFLFCPVLVLDGLVDAGVAGGPLDVDSMETAVVGLVLGDAVFEGVSLRTGEDVGLFDLGPVEFAVVAFAPDIGSEVHSRGHLGGKLLSNTVVPGSVRDEVLPVEGIGAEEGAFVVVHA